MSFRQKNEETEQRLFSTQVTIKEEIRDENKATTFNLNYGRKTYAKNRPVSYNTGLRRSQQTVEVD